MVMRPLAVDLRGATSTPNPWLNSAFGFCLRGRAMFTFWGFLVKSCQFVERPPPPTYTKGFSQVRTFFGCFFCRPCLCALAPGGGVNGRGLQARQSGHCKPLPLTPPQKQRRMAFEEEKEEEEEEANKDKEEKEKRKKRRKERREQEQKSRKGGGGEGGKKKNKRGK